VAGLPLVTGATGFAGSHLVDHLAQTRGAVAAWANPGGRGIPATNDPAIAWQSVDLLDRGSVERALANLRPSAIFHCAGSPHVAGSWKEPGRALRINVLGTHHLFEAMAQIGHACPVLVTGSALVYRPAPTPLTEDSPIGPASPYGVSKLAQEMCALRATDVPVFATRSFNHAGPRQTPDFATSAFARQIADIEAGVSEPVIRVGNLDSRRDITDVRDTVRAYRLLAERGRPGRAYNVCSGQAYRIGDLLDTLIAMARTKVDVVSDPARMRPSDIPLIVGDRSRITRDTKWEPEIPIGRTLSDLLDYWRRQTARPAVSAQ
jgi:GDP-4-dehydro-6-deoxy-D-mannose reductase